LSSTPVQIPTDYRSCGHTVPSCYVSVECACHNGLRVHVCRHSVDSVPPVNRMFSRVAAFTGCRSSCVKMLWLFNLLQLSCCQTSSYDVTLSLVYGSMLSTISIYPPTRANAVTARGSYFMWGVRNETPDRWEQAGLYYAQR